TLDDLIGAWAFERLAMGAPRKAYQGRAAETGGDLGREGRRRDRIEVARKQQCRNIALHGFENIPSQKLDIPVFAHSDQVLCVLQLRLYEARVESRHPNRIGVRIASFGA